MRYDSYNSNTIEQIKQNTHPNGLRLGKGPKGDEFKLLVEALKVNHTLTIIDFSSCNYGCEDIKVLADALKVNKSLLRLDLSKNNIANEGAIALAEALKVNKSLININLWDNRITNTGAIALAEALGVNTSLLTLSLSDNNITREGAMALAEALKVNKSLIDINLWRNQITREGLIALAYALNFNKSLTRLSLDMVGVDDEVVEVLLGALETNKTLTNTWLQLTNIWTRVGRENFSIEQTRREVEEALKPNITKAKQLLAAAKEGNLERVKQLVNSEVSLNFQDEVGNTALHYAAAANHQAIVDFLLAQPQQALLFNYEDELPKGITLRNPLIFDKVEVTKKLNNVSSGVNVLIDPTSGTQFDRHAVSADGNCGYTAFCITRQEAYQKLRDNLNQVRTLLQPVIKESLLTEAFIQYLEHKELATSRLLTAFRNYQQAVQQNNNVDETTAQLYRYADDLAILNAYLDYDIRDKKIDIGWSHPAILQALAHVQAIELYIWQLSTNQQVMPHGYYPHYSPGQVSGRIDLLFVNGNHFERLERLVPHSPQQTLPKNERIHEGITRKSLMHSQLHLAVKNNDAAQVCSLLKAGADPNCRDEVENTPIHYWSIKENPSTVILDHLLDYGANPHSTNQNLDSPFTLIAAKSATISFPLFKKLLGRRKLTSWAEIDALFRHCKVNYLGTFESRQYDKCLLDHAVQRLIGHGISVADILETNKLRYMAHLLSLAGRYKTSSQVNEESFEGFNSIKFLIIRLRTLFEILLHIEKGYLGDAVPKVEQATAKLQQELVVCLESTRLLIEQLYINNNQLSHSHKIGLRNVFIANMVANIKRLKPDESICYPGGWQKHCVYIHFKVYGSDKFLIRIDNLGEGCGKHLTQEDSKGTKKVKRMPNGKNLGYYYPFALIADETKLKEYIEKIILADDEKFETASKKLYETIVIKLDEKVIRDSFPAKLKQTVGNCVVKNFHQGMQIRLRDGADDALYRWFRKVEIRYLPLKGDSRLEVDSQLDERLTLADTASLSQEIRDSNDQFALACINNDRQLEQQVKAKQNWEEEVTAGLTRLEIAAIFLNPDSLSALLKCYPIAKVLQSDIIYQRAKLQALYARKEENFAVLTKFEAEQFSKAHDYTELHQAVINGDRAKVQQILNNSTCDIHAKTANGYSALDFAIMHQHKEIGELLTQKGCKCKLDNNFAKTLVESQKAESKNQNLPKIAKNSQPVKLSEQQLLDLIKNKKPIEQLKQQLEGYRSIVQGEPGQTLLAAAAMEAKNKESYDLLVQFGCDPNVPNKDGTTLIEIAIKADDLQAITILICTPKLNLSGISFLMLSKESMKELSPQLEGKKALTKIAELSDFIDKNLSKNDVMRRLYRQIEDQESKLYELYPDEKKCISHCMLKIEKEYFESKAIKRLERQVKDLERDLEKLNKKVALPRFFNACDKGVQVGDQAMPSIRP